MWGSILTEANTLTNFNFGFSTYKSDILLHLSQWQYWWWFWFSLIWSVYFFLIIRLMSKRTFAFNPILNTSIRGHGKWGDFLVAIIPLSWCGNILVNSNFILRMIEWQNESSLFTVRVQGKQWYWVYKFDATAAQNIYAAPKNIGHNRWFINTPLESYCADSYYQALNLGTQLEFRALYYKYLNDDGLTQARLNTDSLQSIEEKFTRSNSKNLQINIDTRIKLYNTLYFRPRFIKKNYIKKINIIDKNINMYFLNYGFNLNLFEEVKNSLLKSLQKNSSLVFNTSFYDFEQIDDLSNFAANVAQHNTTKPITIVRGILNKHNLEILRNSLDFNHSVTINNIDLYKKISNRLVKLLEIPYYRKKVISPKTYLRMANQLENLYPKTFKKIIKKPQLTKIEKKNKVFIEQKYLKNLKNLQTTFYNISEVKLIKPLFFNILFNKNSLVEKIEDNELLWGFRQKKYKRFKKFFFNKGLKYNAVTLEPVSSEQSKSRQFKNNIISDVGGKLTRDNISYHNSIKLTKDNINYHNAIKYNRHRNELVPVNLARRLLRVKRTLVLPAHTNITIISNSYDVVHSWFIPGLGLKIDCVPGRSTHHTFYIDNVGFYYGQCAEICGRYHHHMPIRICALPFEHFLVWWQKKGLKRLHRMSYVSSSENTKLLIKHGSAGVSLNKGLDLIYWVWSWLGVNAS